MASTRNRPISLNAVGSHSARRRLLGLVVGGVLAWAGTAGATNYTWTPTGAGTYDWNDAPTNWGGGFPNASGDSANLSIALAGSQTINLNQVITVGTINLGSTNGTYGTTIAAGTGGSLIMDVASGSATITRAWNGSGTTDLISANVQLNDNLSVNDSIISGAALTISGNISESGGSRSLTKNGTGTLVLSGTNSFTGLTFVSAGVLQYNSPSAIAGSGHNVFVGTGATVVANYAIDQAFIDRLDSTSQGTVGLMTSTSANLDFTNFSGYLGASHGRSVTYSGILTPNGTTYRLVAGYSNAGNVSTLTLNQANAVTGSGNTLVVGPSDSSTGGGGVVLTADNDIGTVTVNGPLTLSGLNGALTAATSINLNASASTRVYGYIVVDNSSGSSNNNARINDNANLNFRGGTFKYLGSSAASTNSTETVGNVSVFAGPQSTIAVTYGSTNRAVITAGTLTRSVGQGTMLVNGVGLGKDTASTVSVARLLLSSAPALVGTTPALATGINAAANNTQIVPFLVGEATGTTGGVGTASGTPNTFVTYNATTGLRPLNPTDEFSANAITAGSNVRITAATVANASMSINSLLLAGTGALSINDGVTLANASGVVLFAETCAIQPTTATGILDFTGREGILTVNNGKTGTISTQITGDSGLTMSGTGTLVLSGVNIYTGATTINSGTLQIGGAGQLGNGTYSDAIVIGLGATFNYNSSAAQTLQTGVISGDGSLAKANTSTLTLSGANTYTGLTTVSGGTLKLGAAGGAVNGPLGTTAAGTTVSSGGALDLNGFSLGTAEALTLSGTGVSSGGALTNSSATAATYSGLITLGGASSIVATNGDIILSNTGTITGATFGLTLGGTTSGSSIASVIGTTTGTVTKTGTGTWTLTGANTYSGTTKVSAGTLSINTIADWDAGSPTATALGAPTSLASGTIAIGNTTTAGTLVYTGGVQNTNRPISLSGTTGGATIDQSGNGLLRFTSTDAIATGAGSKTLTLQGSTTGSGQLDGILADNTTTYKTSLTKAGTGTWTLTGANTYSGGTTVNGGTLVVANTSGSATGLGSVTLNGGTLTSTAGTILGSVNAGSGAHAIAPGGDGSAGILSTGGITLGSLSTFKVDLNGLTVGSGYDRLIVTGGTPTLGNSTLSISTSGYMPGTGDRFFILDNQSANGISGTFNGLAQYAVATTIGGKNFKISYTGDTSTNAIIGGNDVVLYEVSGNDNTRILITAAPDAITNSGNANSGTASTHAFGRVMLNSTQTTGSYTVGKTGSDITGYTVGSAGDVAGSTLASGSFAGDNQSASGTVTLNTSSAGSKAGTVTITNNATDSSASGYGSQDSNDVITVTGTVVQNRPLTLSQTTFHLGILRVGQAISANVPTNFTINDSSGLDSNHGTLLNPVSPVADTNGISVSGGSVALFDGAVGHTSDTRSLAGTFGGVARLASGTLTFAYGSGSDALTGQNNSTLAVSYDASVFSGSSRWVGATGGSWGPMSSNTSWHDTSTASAINIAPGMDASYANTDTAVFDQNAGAAATITLGNANPSLANLNFNSTTTSYTIAQAGTGTLTLKGPTATIALTSGVHVIAAPVVLASNTNIVVSRASDTLTVRGLISGAGTLTKTGDGNLTLGGADTLSTSGGVVLNGGTLAAPYGISHSGAAITLTAPGTLMIGGRVSRAISGTGTVTATDDLLVGKSSQAGQFNLGGVPGVGGTLNVGANAVVIMSSDKIILGGQTNLADGGSLTTLNGAQLGNASSLDATKVLTASGNVTVNGDFINNGVVHGPDGLLQWLTFTQDVKGAGSTTGNIFYAGSYSPGNSPAAVSVENVSFGPTSVFIVEIGGPQAGSQHDQLNVSGQATLAGTLDVSQLNGYGLEPGQSYQLIAGRATGEFDQVVGLPSGWHVDYSGSGVTILPEPTSLSLLGLGLAGLLLRRRKSQSL